MTIDGLTLDEVRAAVDHARLHGWAEGAVDEGPVRRLHRVREVPHPRADAFLRGEHVTEHTLRWPTLVGGPMSGQAAPSTWAQGTDTNAFEFAAFGLADDPADTPGPLAARYEEALYVQQALVYGASDTFVRVEALVWHRMPVAEAVKFVLLRALGVPGL